MNKLIRILIAAGLGWMAGSPAWATVYGGQVDTTSTTLSAAVTSTPNTQVCLGSATNVNTTSVSQTGSYLVVDKEAMQVTTAGSSSTCFNVKRGQLGTANSSHLSGRKVWVANVATGSGDTSRPFSGGAIAPTAPNGSCTASLQYSLPVIFVPPNNAVPVMDAVKYYCFAGVWTDGEEQQGQGQSPYSFATTYPTPGNVVAPSAATDVNGKIWYAALYVPYNMNTTGACILNGSTSTTDKWVLALWDAAGNVLATTAVAGTTTGTASLYQCIPWIAAMNLTGPNTYFVGVQGNGTTDTFSAYKTGGAPTNYPTGAITGGTFGTIVAIATPATTFTTAVGPYMSLY